MKKSTHGGARPGAGRPLKRPERRNTRIMVSLPPLLAAWLRQQPDGISGTLQRFIAEAMEHDNGKD